MSLGGCHDGWRVRTCRLTGPVPGHDVGFRTDGAVEGHAVTVRISPITESDVRRVAEFLAPRMRANLSADAWAQAMTVPWKVDAPNHGFMLVADDTIVGVYLAFYSERPINGRVERFCNVASWCVQPEHRLHSMRLLKALLAQPGYHFTDFSPSRDVAKLNTLLGFQSLDSTIAMIRPLPWPSWPGRNMITSAPEVIEETLTGRDLVVYRDHERAAPVYHVVLCRGGEHCYVMFRKAKPSRIREVPFVSIVYASNPTLFRTMARPLARHMLIHHGALAIRAELRVIKYLPHHSPAKPITHIRRMYKSSYLKAEQIEYLYSELTCVDW
jgi:hypothetical protein